MNTGSSAMGAAGTGRMVIALSVLGILAVLVWRTLDPGKAQQLAWLLLGFFAVRVLLGWLRARRMSSEQAAREGDRLDV